MSKIFGAGIDLIEISRISNSIKNKNFIDRIYSKSEIQKARSLKNKSFYFAKRFAAKEAFSKALGTGFRMKLNFKDIEVVNDKMGKPNYVTNKKITKMIQNKFKIKKYNCFLSISDEKKYSTAFAIIQS